MLRVNLRKRWYVTIQQPSPLTVQQPIHTALTMHPGEKHPDQKLFFDLLTTLPSKREAKTYLQKFIDTTTPNQQHPIPAMFLLQLNRKLLNEPYLHQLVETLATLQRLGLNPIILLDPKCNHLYKIYPMKP